MSGLNQRLNFRLLKFDTTITTFSQFTSYYDRAFYYIFYLSLLLLVILESFSHQHCLMDFHWSLSDSKSLQVSRTLLSILANLNNAIVWMISTCPFINSLVTVPRAPIIIGINVTCMFHSFFRSLIRSGYLSFSLSFNFTLWSGRTAKSTILQVVFFCFFFCFFCCWLL